MSGEYQLPFLIQVRRCIDYIIGVILFLVTRFDLLGVFGIDVALVAERYALIYLCRMAVGASQPACANATFT